jgi:hypothetical protein
VTWQQHEQCDERPSNAGGIVFDRSLSPSWTPKTNVAVPLSVSDFAVLDAHASAASPSTTTAAVAGSFDEQKLDESVVLDIDRGIAIPVCHRDSTPENDNAGETFCGWGVWDYLGCCGWGVWDYLGCCRYVVRASITSPSFGDCKFVVCGFFLEY